MIHGTHVYDINKYYKSINDVTVHGPVLHSIYEARPLRLFEALNLRGLKSVRVCGGTDCSR